MLCYGSRLEFSTAILQATCADIFQVSFSQSKVERKSHSQGKREGSVQGTTKQGVNYYAESKTT